MASLDQLSWKHRLLMRGYRYRRIQPTPWQPLDRALAACRVALVSSAGLVPPGQPDFDERVRGGDYSYRVIDGEADLAELRECHRSSAFDHADVQADGNVALPLDRLRELAAEGVIGAVAPRHLSFMGSIPAPGRLMRHTAPEAAALLREDAVDIALLVPI
ncbi:glycine/sarcosine/betaine reductase selenoprotein B family protein [Haliangium ochraceum]|uniref:Selenoprotein B glycine/betaine/sarcosine/D-proline reductase n=1 Tax=Haliangium ochraceum (strain DSM 14365 / JCM 11303 / SMP-2) TaxID=502025 RepID=D0LFS6_HALO1|nr:glycine/sarcosine/betaine reductase selenoprotein B family protein [Haliangium ochraceum]ACY14528.1 conserved hypothetical protein [Haliangium ochraceum DSM 14365]